MPEWFCHMSLSTQTLRALTCVEAGGEDAFTLLEAEEEDIDWGSLDESLSWLVGCCLRSEITLSNTLSSCCCKSTLSTASHSAHTCSWFLIHDALGLQLFHCLACFLFVTAQLFNSIALFDWKARNESLVSLNVRHMQVNLLLKHNQFLVHSNLQVVAGCLDFSFKLEHFFFLHLTRIRSHC